MSRNALVSRSRSMMMTALLGTALVWAAPAAPPFPQNVLVNQDKLRIRQGETTQAVDPADPQRRVAAWINYGPGDTVTIGTALTTDGGQRWRSQTVPNPPGLQYAADPVLAVDSRGTFYLTTLGYNLTGGFFADESMFLYRSVDGGKTFALINDLTIYASPDKEWIAADPVTGALHLVWSGNLPGVGSGIFYRTSLDGGTTFSAPVLLSDPRYYQSIYSVVSIGPGGELYVTWFDFGLSNAIWLDRSLDGGRTWLSRDIALERRLHYAEPPDINPGGPANAVDRSNGPYRGRLYVVYPDARFGSIDILLRYSDDRGDTWSDPVRVNDDAPGNGAAQFLPWINVDDAGAVHVTFLDRRGAADNLSFAVTLATSTDGGASFGPNIRASDRLLPYNPSADFLGDYNQMIVAGTSIHPIWSDSRRGDTDIFTQAVPLADFDSDGILNDGDGDGQYADHRCTGGLTAGCDDNCPGIQNARQEDADGDLVGDACDNCPTAPNTDQSDLDRDDIGDACDAG